MCFVIDLLNFFCFLGGVQQKLDKAKNSDIVGYWPRNVALGIICYSSSKSSSWNKHISISNIVGAIYNPQLVLLAQHCTLHLLIKGTVQRILRGGESRLKPSVLLNWKWQIFVLNFKGTPSQEGHKTIFSDLKIEEMAFSDQIDFLAFFHLQKIT